MKEKAIVGGIAAIVMLLVFIIGIFSSVKDMKMESVNLNEDSFTNMEFTVDEPSNIKNSVNADMFGFSVDSDNNEDALRAMAKYLESNPNTQVDFQKGVYHIYYHTPIHFDNIKNCIVNGNGSEFKYAGGWVFTSLTSCDTFEIKNLDFDWDYDKGGELGTLIEITDDDKGKDNSTYKAKIVGSNADKSMDEFLSSPWMGLTYVNKETRSMVGGPSENYDFDRDITKKEKMSDTEFSFTYKRSDLNKGEYYMIRHRIYEGGLFNVEASTNITLDSLRSYGVAGMFFVSGNGTDHVRINNCFLGLRDNNVISATADGIHFSNGGGYYIIENCDMGYAGDDFINIHPNAADIREISDDGTLTVYTNSPDILVENKNFGIVTSFDKEPTVKAKIVSVEKTDDGLFKVKLDKSVKKNLISKFKGAFLADLDFTSNNYIIRNNKFHDGRARGILLNSSHGLVENNEFYHNGLSDIRLTVDHTEGSWVEGNGFEKILIRNNNLHDSVYNKDDAPITFYGHCENISGKPFKDILVENNTFKNYNNDTVRLSSVNNAVCKNNVFDSCKGKIVIEKSCKNIKVADNEYVNGTKRIDKPIDSIAKNIFV